VRNSMTSLPSVTTSDTTRGLRGHPWWVLASVAFGVVMVGLDGTVVAVANPVIARDLHTSVSQLQWITNAYLLVLAVGLVFGGKLGDRFGRRKVFLVGVVGFALSSLAVGLIGTTGGVIAFRAVQGAFGSLLMPNTLAILRATFPKEKLNMAIGIWGGASGISVASGPIVGGLLVQHVSWQSVFYLNVPVAAVALTIGLIVLPESRDERRPRFDVLGVVLLGAGLFAIVFALINAQTWGWASARTFGLLFGGVAVLAAFVVVERRTAAPLLPMRLFASRSLSIGTLVVVIGFLSLFGVLFFLTLYLENVHGYTAVQAGVRLLPLTATLIASAPIGGVLNERIGARFTMSLGLALIGGGLLWLTGINVDAAYGALWPPFVMIGAGLGCMITSSSEVIVGNAPVADAGIAGGIQSTATQLGGVMGTAILGSVLTTHIGSVLVRHLVAAGTPNVVASKLDLPGVVQLAGQGLSVRVPGAPASIQSSVAAGMHAAFVSGLHASLFVGAVIAFCAAALALAVRRGANALADDALADHALADDALAAAGAQGHAAQAEVTAVRRSEPDRGRPLASDQV